MSDILLKKILESMDPRNLKRQWDRIKSNKTATASIWELIRRNINPSIGDYLGNQPGHLGLSKQRGNYRACSSVTAGIISQVVSNLSSQLTDSTVRWLGFKFPSPTYLADGSVINLADNSAVQGWMELAEKAHYALFADPDTNFYKSTPSFHQEWFVIGNSCREVILRRDNGKIQVNTISMDQIYVDLDGYGDIGVICREFKLTLNQAYERWGDNLHERDLEKLMRGDEYATIEETRPFVQMCIPTPMYALSDLEKLIAPKYTLITVDFENNHIVESEAHRYSPYVVARFLIPPGEIYGTSYVWNAMPDILNINTFSKRAVEASDFATKPIYLVHDATSLMASQITPGAIVQGLDQNGRQMFKPEMLNTGFPFLFEYYKAKIEDLKEILLAKDIGTPMDGQPLTATEINQRTIQTYRRLKPILTMLECEDLAKTIRRTWSLLEQTGKIPQFPYEEIINPNTNMPLNPMLLPNPLEQLQIFFSGQMAKMQSMQNIQDNDMLLQRVIMAAQANPGVLDNINFDEMIRSDADVYGTSQRILITRDEVQAERARRAEEQKKQYNMEMQMRTQEAMTRSAR